MRQHPSIAHVMCCRRERLPNHHMYANWQRTLGGHQYLTSQPAPCNMARAQKYIPHTMSACARSGSAYGSLVFLQLYWCPSCVLSLLYVPGQAQVLQGLIISQHLQTHSSTSTVIMMLSGTVLQYYGSRGILSAAVCSNMPPISERVRPRRRALWGQQQVRRGCLSSEYPTSSKRHARLHS